MKILYTSLIMMLVGCGVEEHKGIVVTRGNYTQPVETQVPDENDTGLQESVVTQAPVVIQQPESTSATSASSSIAAITSTSSTTTSTIQAPAVVSVFVMKSIVDYGLVLTNGLVVTSDQLEQMKNNGRQVTLTRITSGAVYVGWQFNDGYIIFNSTQTLQNMYVKSWIEVRYTVN